MKNIVISLLIISAIFINPVQTSALIAPSVEGRSLILMEKTTGTILFDVNAHVRIYPASTTKILSSILMVEHIGMDEIITIGPEISHMPQGSSRAGHREGTSISGLNLLRALIIPSGNDSGIVLATEVVRRTTGNHNLSYPEMEQIFAEMMTEKAKELGALNSNFMNPHGFHHPNHYSTPFDMATIARAALEYPILVQVFSEAGYAGPGIEGDLPEGVTTSNYNWNSPNLLIHEDSEHFFPYAAGMRTGFHDHAAHALVSTAAKDGFQLIAGAFQARAYVRFTDSITMFNYGFDNYGFKHIQVDGNVVDHVPLHRPMLGEATHMDIIVEGDFIDILQLRDFDIVRQNLVFNPTLFYTSDQEDNLNTEADRPRLRLPVEEGAILGEIIYTVNGAAVHRSDLIASTSAMPRTMETDFYYYRDIAINYLFSISAIPIWIGVFIILLLIIRSIAKRIRRNRRRKIFDRPRRGRGRTSFKHRRY